MAAYNGSKWIKVQIDSILSQQDVDVDLVVSDDRSTDDTLIQIQTSTNADRFRVVSPVERNGSAAQHFFWLIRNTSVGQSTFVALADQDDIWNEQKLARACQSLENAGASAYSCAVSAFWEDGRERTLTQCVSLTESDYMFEGAGQGCTFVLTSAFYKKVRAFLLDDAEHTRRLHYHDWTIYALSRVWQLNWIFDGVPMTRYRQHSSNDTGARSSIAGFGRRIRLIHSRWYSDQLKAIAAICARAAPSNSLVMRWNGILLQQRGILRAFRVARFCFKGGRRRSRDNFILICSAIIGWI